MPHFDYPVLRRMLCVVGVAVVFVTQTLFAASVGTVRGRVFDKDSKDALPGANVLVRGTSLGAAADLNGNFVIHNVPVGSMTLTISFVGYRSVSLPVTTLENQDVRVDVPLEVQTILGQTVVVTAQAKGQMQAINQQLASSTITSVVSEAKIQELPDFNAAEAIGRLPGVSTLRSSGEANKIVIRGMAPQYNLVSVDNITLGATGKDDRSVDLTMITPYMLQSIDVAKSLTPDMEANAIGGSVNMQLREAPSGLHAEGMWQSGYTAKNKKYGNYKASGAISDRFFGDKLGVYALLNAEQYDRASDNFNAGYNIFAEKSPYADVFVQNMSLNRHYETRSRYGANLILDYKLPAGSVSLVNMLSRLNSQYQDYNTQFDYVNKGLNFTYGRGDANTDLAINAVQGKYDFDLFSVDVSIAHSYTRNFNPKIANYQFGEGLGIASVPTQPNVYPEQLVSLTRFNPLTNYIQQLGYNSADFRENDQTYSGNVKVPFNWKAPGLSGFVKAGGIYRSYNRVNDESAPYAQFRYQGNELVAAVRQNYPGVSYDTAAQQIRSITYTSPDQGLTTNFLSDKFGNLVWAPSLPGLDAITDYVIANYPNSLRYYRGDYSTKINDYTYREYYTAGYAMAELDLGPELMVVGGARYEEDHARIYAYAVQQQNTWSAERATQNIARPKNNYLLPMVNARYNFAEWGDVRYAYTQTLARPSFTQVAPYENADANGQYVNAGNPNLKPAHAFNHDLMVTVHNNEIGLVSVGGFYKEITDFSYFIQYQLLNTRTVPGFDIRSDHPMAMAGATLGTFYNNPYRAFLRGFEVDLQTRFWYLPFPMDGIVLGINYTHINSNTYYPRLLIKTIPPVPPSRVPTTILQDSSRQGRLIFQPDDIVNASLGYDYKGFSARLSFLFQGNMVSGIGTRIEQDSFTKDYFRMDASVRQKLPWEGLQVFLDVNNINERADISAQTSIGGFTSERFYGLTADLGIRYTY